MLIRSDIDYYDVNQIHIYKFKIQYEEDLKSLSKIIAKSDIIRLDHPESVFLIVENVEYVEDPDKVLIIAGKRHIYDDLQLISISLNDIFCLKTYDFRKIEQLETKYKLYEKYKESVSDSNIQKRCFDILHQYMNKNLDKIVFGKDVISNIKEDLIHVVMVNWSFIKQQDETWFSLLTNKDHKIKRANIVVYDKGTENYEELKNFGGIVGVLF